MFKFVKTIPVRRLAAAVLGGVVLLAGPVVAKEPAKAVTGAPLMWVVKDADSTLYLLGSIHVLKPDMVWQDARITKALESSDEMWLEIANMDDQQAASQAFMKNAANPGGNLTEGMTPDEVKALDAALAKYQIPAAAANNLKPWAVGIFITLKTIMAEGYDPNSGVDKVMFTKAKALGKPVRGFETIEQQMDFFGAMDAETGRQFLKDTLKQDAEGSKLMDALLKAWVTGDEPALNRLMVTEMKETTPKLYDTLLKGRNQAWVPQIEQILDGKGTTLIVVGTGHLVGEDGVPAMLRKEGIKVEAVTR